MSDHHQTKRSTIISTLSLLFQSGYSALLGMAVNLILPAIISVKSYGIYITTLSIIAILNYFADIGLAASLIQKKELTDEDITTTFTVQQLLIITMITIGYILTPWIQQFYKLPKEGVYLYWALLLSFFISSLKTIPSVLLERNIQFPKIVFVQMVESTIFYSTVIVFAILGFDLRSFTFSVLLRAIIGLILIYWLSFWRPRLGISKTSLNNLLKFGLPFQATSFIALFKDDLIILFLSKMLGFEAVAYLGWAKKWAEASIRIVMDNIGKVMFPLIAKYQDDKVKVSYIMNRILYYQMAIIAPTLVGTVFAMPTIVQIIPKYSKFTVALPYLYIFALSSFLVSLSSPFINLFNALGKVKWTLTYMVMITIITWILTPPLIHLYGRIGFPITHLIISSLFIFVILFAKRHITVTVIRSIYKFVLSALGMGIVLFTIKLFLPSPSILQLILLVGSGILSYALLLHFIFSVKISEELQQFRQKV